MIDNGFSGIQTLYSSDGYNKIKDANFLVIGIGGVGSWICESLIRSGAENITIVDLDDICISNLNRQIHTHQKNIGKLKVEEMKSRMLLINPKANINAIVDFFSEKTADEILSPDYNYIFDGIDSLKSKCILLSECRKRKIPVICSGGAGGLKDPTKIEINDLNRTINDPLLLRVRRKLKYDFGFPRYENKKFHIPTIFSTELPPKYNNEIQGSSCTQFGSASFVTASFAFAMVAYVLNSITGNNE